MTKKNSNNKPPISVVVPCYNVADTVERCLQSIRDQSYTNFKVIIVNDGSTDNTADVAGKYIVSDNRFKLFHKPNGGLSSARNFGLDKVDTEFVCFIDSDDYIEPEYLELLLKSLEDNQSDISACYAKAVYPNFNNIVTFENDFSGLARMPAAWNKLYKTELFHQYNLSYPEGKCYEDVEVSSELLLINAKFSVVPIPLYNYIQNPKSISHTYDQTIYDIYDVLGNISKFAARNDLTEECRDKLEFINLFQQLISTTTRAAHCENFSPNILADILDHLENQFPRWIHNSYLNTLPPMYRKYLRILHKHRFGLAYMALLTFNDNTILRNVISKFGRKRCC